MIWNIEQSRKKTQETLLKQHARAVNRLSWHPTDTFALLSASQDATLKLWDTRAGKCGLTIRPNSNSIRDVCFSPYSPTVFAAAFDSGRMQIWDVRMERPMQTTLAHNGPVLAVSFHPTVRGKIATGGRDKLVKVWAHNKSTVTMERCMQTIASVSRLGWRPGRPDEIATSSSVVDSTVNIWNVRKTELPVTCLRGHRDVVCGMEWCRPSEVGGRDYIVCCSKDGQLALHAPSAGHSPWEHICATGVSSSTGVVSAFSRETEGSTGKTTSSMISIEARSHWGRERLAAGIGTIAASWGGSTMLFPKRKASHLLQPSASGASARESRMLEVLQAGAGIDARTVDVDLDSCLFTEAFTSTLFDECRGDLVALGDEAATIAGRASKSKSTLKTEAPTTTAARTSSSFSKRDHHNLAQISAGGSYNAHPGVQELRRTCVVFLCTSTLL